MSESALDLDTLQAVAAGHPTSLSAVRSPGLSAAVNPSQASPFDDRGRIVEAYRNGTMRTSGEKTFDALAYWVNGFGTNLVLSTLITYYFVDNKHGQQAFKQLLKGYEKAGIQNEKVREVMARAFTLLLGGHITAAGVKIAEDNKLDLVKWLDRQFYGDEAEMLPEIKAGHAHVAEESKPTWLNIALARMICWSVIQGAAFACGNEDSNLVMNLGKKYNIPVLKEFSVEGWSRVAGEKVVNHTPHFVENGVNKLCSPLATSDPDLVYKKLMHYGAIDTLYTMITAALLKPVTAQLRKLPSMRIDPQIEADMEAATHLPSVAFDHTKLPSQSKKPVDDNAITTAAATAETPPTDKDKTDIPEKNIQKPKLDGLLQAQSAQHHAAV